MFMKPQAFYELVNEIELMFADVKCQYLFVQAEDVVGMTLLIPHTKLRDLHWYSVMPGYFFLLELGST